LFFALFFSLTLQELIPNGAYKGQKLIMLVYTNIPASINSTIPNVPVTVSVTVFSYASAAVF
jgi:hypothetical protein